MMAAAPRWPGAARAWRRRANWASDRIIDVGASGDLVAAAAKEGKQDFDVVIEAVGQPEAWQAATRMARKGGKVNFFGGCPAGSVVSLDTNLLHYSNLTLYSSFHHTPRTIRRALELIETGVVRASDFVDGEAFLDDLPGLFQSMTAGNRAVKTLIRVRPHTISHQQSARCMLE
jgi:L-iditol 2-dehydrogenase